MTSGQSQKPCGTDRWPTFELTYTFTPDVTENRFQFDPDEVVIYDPSRKESADGRWISAKREYYLPFDETL